MSDTPEAVIVKAQMPGVSKDHIQVDVTDDVLTLKGEMKEEETKAIEPQHSSKRES